MEVLPNLHSRTWCFHSGEETSEIELGALQSSEHLNTDQRGQLNNLVEEIFKPMGDTLGYITMVEHIIRTTSPLIKQRHYTLSAALQRQINVELD